MNPNPQPSPVQPMVEQLSFSTIQIKCISANGSTSSGTGFFYIMAEKGLKTVPVIITNKHVIKGAVQGRLLFTTAVDGIPQLTTHYEAVINDFENRWIPHPEIDVDLCVLTLVPIILEARKKGVTIYYKAIPKTVLPTQDLLEELDGLENIVMIGYPNGFSDTINNKPIFRKGITATSPKINYCGKPIFLIDSAVFPGSSGSPVFLVDMNGYQSKGEFYMGSRIFLIGVAFAVFHHNAKGQIEQQPINEIKLSVITGVPNHIGLVIRYDKILDFEPFFQIPD